MDRLEQHNIVKEVQNSFIEYSMSVITSRAIPDLRDGLKPVHRRILYSMFESGYTPDKQYRKCARVVGDVMGKYHPHGDSSIYEAMVRMAQNFSYRHMLIDGHGNFGNMDGDGAAAMRYTESKLAKISLELLRDINKETVDFTPNFDETEKEPVVLPSRFPNILVNGTMGIAVGMATNIPPHNLGEVIDGCVAYIDNNDITTDELMQYIKGPDFPTGGIILGNSGIKKAYETGRGTITLRCKADIVTKNDRSYIEITEVPYGTNLSDLKNKIAELHRDKIIDGIADYHEETNIENGLKIVITIKKDANANVVLNNLYKHTTLQSNFGIIFLMIDQKQPKTLPLKDIISKYIDYQREIIYRRTKFDLDKAEARVHILEGLMIAMNNIDEVIKIIRAAATDEEAKTKLMAKFALDEIQTNAILEMKLRRLTGLEREKVEAELKDLHETIAKLKEILASDAKIYEVIKNELLDIKNKYADERRTTIDMTAIDFIEDESLIPEQNIIVTLTNKGYIKRTTSDTFKSQNRGGVGVKGMSTNEDDYVEQMLNMSTHDYIIFFTNKGKTYRIKGYEVPEFARQAKGIPIINLLQIDKEESIKSIVTYKPGEETKYLLFATKNGIVKKTPIEEYESIRSTGKIAIGLRENDELISVKKTDSNNLILLGSSTGRMCKFNENELRPMGRTASGVRGISLDNSECIGCEVVKDDDNILIVTENGYGKKSRVSDFRETKRGSKGVKALSVTEKNGNMATFKISNEESDIIVVTNFGMITRMPISQISTLGRVTQGVRIMNLKDGQKISTISVVSKEEDVTENTSNDETI